MNVDSFIYTINSNDRTNEPLGLVNEYFIQFGGFGNHYSKYYCEVVQLTLSGSIAESLGYVIMLSENLHCDGYHSARPANQATLCCVGTNVDILSTSSGSSFIVDNCQTKREVRLFITGSDYTPLVSGQLGDEPGVGEINQGGTETDWVLTLRMTPIR